METKVSEYEKLRIRNAEDNKAFLAKMMSELKNVLPTQMPKKTQVKKLERADSAIVKRRNPRRNARFYTTYSSYYKRGVRDSSSSSSLTSSMSADSSAASVASESLLSTDQSSSSSFTMDESLSERRQQSSLSPSKRYKKSEVTAEDLELVATSVSEKRLDPFNGTSCHQCRQKTTDTKTICRSDECFGVRGQFCGPCLRNRYGEDARETLQNENWLCPPCRGICNCSFCCKKAGKSCTGILAPTAKALGFSDVNSYLKSLHQKGTKTD